MEKEEKALLDPMTTAQLYAGVDVSKDRLDVCLRWSEPERREDALVLTHDEAGIDTLVSRLVEEHLVMVILMLRSSNTANKKWIGHICLPPAFYAGQPPEIVPLYLHLN